MRDAAGVTLAVRRRTTVAKRAATATQNVPPPVVGGFGAASTPVAQQSVSQVPPQGPRGRRVYRGATVDFDFKDAPIHDLLRLIADTGGVNIVVPDDDRRQGHGAAQARAVGPGARGDPRVARPVVPPRGQPLPHRAAQGARRRGRGRGRAPRGGGRVRGRRAPRSSRSTTRRPTSCKPKLEAHAVAEGQDRGRRPHERADHQRHRRQPRADRAARAASSTPRPRRSRSRRASSRRARRSSARSASSGVVARSPARPAATRPAWSSRRRSASPAATRTPARPTGRRRALPSDFAVNLPAATGTGEGGAIGLSLGSVGGNFNINLRLSALEDTGTVRIISAPKITVLNNKEAMISQGVSIPISVVSAAGTQTQFVQADLVARGHAVRLAARLRDRDEPRRHEERARLRQRRRSW